MWSLDNFGDKAICLIHDSAVFEWDSSLSNATDTRATIISGAPTASRHMLVSTPDRHLVFFGTETTIGDTSTQDDMFVRFSDQEDIKHIHLQQPIQLVHKDWLMDHRSEEQSEVEMQFMFGLIQRYLLNVLLVNHLRLRLHKLELTVDLLDRMHVLKLMVLRIGCQRMVSLDMLVN